MTTTFDTHSVLPRQRQAYWQDVVCQTFVPLECRITTPEPFDGHLRASTLADLTVAQVRAAEQQVHRTSPCIARSDDEYVLVSLAHEGKARVLQDGREATLEPGDFAIYDTRHPYELRFSGSFSQTVLQIPYRALRERICNIERMTALALSQKNPIVRLAFGYLAGLAALNAETHAEAQQRLAYQGLDLLAVALGEFSSNAIQPTTHRTALLYRIKRYVRNHLGDPELALATVAGAFAVTPRYINSLFQDEGLSFGRFLLSERLQACASQLRDPAQQALAISTVAYRAGFVDMAYFSRVFKARYKVTARDFRSVDRPMGGAR